MSNATTQPVVEKRWLVEITGQRPGVRINKIDQRLGLHFQDSKTIVRDANKAEQCRLCGYKVTQQGDAIIQQMISAEAALESAKQAAGGPDDSDPTAKRSKKE